MGKVFANGTWGVGEEMRGRYLGGSGLGLGTGTQTGPPTREKQRPAGSEVGAPAKPAPRSQKEHPPEAENKFRCFCEILDIALLALGGSYWHRSGRVFGSAAFLVFSGILF